MFFFGFIASFRPEVRRLLQRYPALCPVCANPALTVAEVDKVLRIFFLPVWRSKAHELMVICQNCGFMIDKSRMDELEARRRFFKKQRQALFGEERNGNGSVELSERDAKGVV